uniref:Reverse transcriptase Ty1/copia-type domain-containing protein n=1 Tax=Chenopodium quinoa TaxID=63459 RepID=A0A803LDF8_CHEQI
MNDIIKLKHQLSKEFDMKDLGPAKKILGMQITRDKQRDTLQLSQSKYIKRVLQRFNMGDAKPVSTPLASHFRLSKDQSPQTDEDKEYMAKSSSGRLLADNHALPLKIKVPVLVGSSVKMAKVFLKTNDEIFAGRPRNIAGKYTAYNYSDITWSQYGPYWRQARKMCLMELFSSKRLDSYEYIRVEELKSMLRGIFNTSEEPILLRDYLFALNLNVISRMVLGKKYTEKNNEEKSIVTIEEFKMMVDELFLLSGVFNLGDWIPLLKRENEKESWVPKDMMDVLLKLADDPTNEVKLERVVVKAFCQDSIVGGGESSTITVEWAISELIRGPDIVEKATEELDRVIGKERWAQ